MSHISGTLADLVIHVFIQSGQEIRFMLTPKITKRKNGDVSDFDSSVVGSAKWATGMFHTQSFYRITTNS